MAATLPGQILAALVEQTVIIPATEQYGRVIRGLAAQLLSVLEQRDDLAAELEELLAAHPLAEILTSMPGVGPRTAIELLRTVGDGSTFASAAHIAAYAGLAPATRQSGRTIKGEHQARRGNRALSGALYISAFASLKHPPSRAYYDRKTSRRQDPHRRADLPGPPPRRRPARHDPRPPALPAPTTSTRHHDGRRRPTRSLTKLIGTPLCQDAAGVGF